MHIIGRTHVYHRIILLGISVFLTLFAFYGLPERSIWQQSATSMISDNRSTLQQTAQNGINRTANSRLRILEFEKKYCYAKNNCTLLQPLLDFSGRHLVAPKYGIAACAILKNFSTVLTSILCYLYNTTSYEQSVPDMMKDTWDSRYCGSKNEYFGNGGYRAVELRKMQSTLNLWRYYVITREPMERFISGFLDKCILEKVHTPEAYKRRVNPCYGCGDSLKCFLEQQYRQYERATRGGRPGYGLENEHFAPQNWYCQLKAHYAEYQFFHYSRPNTAKLLDELSKEFELMGVPRNVTDRIKKQVIGRRTYHTTYDSDLRLKYLNELKNDPHLMEIFLKIYFYDYVYFGYPLPDLI